MRRVIEVYAHLEGRVPGDAQVAAERRHGEGRRGGAGPLGMHLSQLQQRQGATSCSGAAAGPKTGRGSGEGGAAGGEPGVKVSRRRLRSNDD